MVNSVAVPVPCLFWLSSEAAGSLGLVCSGIMISQSTLVSQYSDDGHMKPLSPRAEGYILHLVDHVYTELQ